MLFRSAGHWGIPRRHWDISFSTIVSLRANLLDSPEVGVFLALMGIGAIVAILGGMLFIHVIVGTVILGKRSDTPEVGPVPADTFHPSTAAGGASVEHAETGFAVPGTVVLAFGFLVLFIVLYGYSWFELSSVPWRFS